MHFEFFTAFITFVNVFLYIGIIYAVVRLIIWCNTTNKKIDEIHQKLEKLIDSNNK